MDITPKNLGRIDIFLVTFNRLEMLKKTVEAIYRRTRWPYRLIVIDNNSTDGTREYLKKTRLNGMVQENLFLSDNKGYAHALTEGFKEYAKSEYLITTQDDCIPPDLKPCWLERELQLFIPNEEEYAGLAMRIQRIRHREVHEDRDIIESPSSLASVFRIQKKSDIDELGGFGNRPHWESTAFMNRTALLKKKLGVITHLYADHIGFTDNKGFEEGFTKYHTFAPNKWDQHLVQPYPETDKKTNVPVRIISDRDLPEHERRLKFWDIYGFKKSAVMLESLRRRHGQKNYEFIQMSEFTHLLYTLARDYIGVGTIVEIGVANGVSTNSFLYGLHDRTKAPKERMLWSIDIEDRSKFADVDPDIISRWKFIQADSKSVPWDGAIDILLIDGDHSYDAVKADYNSFAPRVRKGGLILLHDVSWEDKGVKKFYEEDLKSPGIILPLGPSGMALITV